MGGTGGGKFILQFDLEGKGEDTLKRIIRRLKSLAKLGSSEASDGVDQLNEALNRLGGATQAAAARMSALKDVLEVGEMGFQRLNSWAEGFISVGSKALGMLGSLGVGILNAVAPTERLALQLKVLGRMNSAQSAAVQESVDQLVAATPFLTEELQGVTQALVMGGASLDAWRDSAGKVLTLSDQVAAGFTRLDEAATEAFGNVTTNALSVVADFAAVTNNVGERMPHFVFGLQRALSTGTARLLADQLNPQAMKALVGAAGLQVQGTADDVIKRMYEYLKENNAVGMAALASSTADGIMSNFKEIPLLLFKAIGGDPNDPQSVFGRIKSAVMTMFVDISKVINNKAWQKGMTEAFSGITDVAKALFGWIGKMTAAILNFASTHPTLTKYGLIFLAFAAAVSVATGVVMAFAAQLGLAIIGMLALQVAVVTRALPALQALKLSLLPVGVGFTKIIAIAALVAAAIYGVYKAVDYLISISPSMQRFLGGVSAFFSGFLEAMEHWSGESTSISEETAIKLENAGLMKPFLNLMGIIRGLEKLYDHFMNKMDPVIFRLWEIALRAVGIEAGNAGSKIDVLGTIVDFVADVAVWAFDKMIVGIGVVAYLVGLLMQSWVNLRFVIVSAGAVFAGFVNIMIEGLKGVAILLAHIGAAFVQLFTSSPGKSVDILKKGIAEAFSGVGDAYSGIGDQIGKEANNVFDTEQAREGVNDLFFGEPTGVTGPRFTVPDDSSLRYRGVAAGLQSNGGVAEGYSIAQPMSDEVLSTIMSVANRPVQVQNTVKLEVDGQELYTAVKREAIRNQEAGFTPYEGVE